MIRIEGRLVFLDMRHVVLHTNGVHDYLGVFLCSSSSLDMHLLSMSLKHLAG